MVSGCSGQYKRTKPLEGHNFSRRIRDERWLLILEKRRALYAHEKIGPPFSGPKLRNCTAAGRRRCSDRCSARPKMAD